jgi:SAM-dependent methyltransferase
MSANPVLAVVRRLFTLPGRIHWCRVVMERECDAFADGLDTAALACLEISAGRSRWPKRKWASYKSTAFPGYDLCAAPLAERFDIIIAEQVLEHVPDPQKALDNIFAMLNPGGIALITTPFLIKYHAYPHDYYRWTAGGMRLMLERAGFTEVTVDSWGNRDCLIADMSDDNSWTHYDPARHSLRNDPRFALVVWAFARK